MRRKLFSTPPNLYKRKRRGGGRGASRDGTSAVERECGVRAEECGLWFLWYSAWYVVNPCVMHCSIWRFVLECAVSFAVQCGLLVRCGLFGFVRRLAVSRCGHKRIPTRSDPPGGATAVASGEQTALGSSAPRPLAPAACRHRPLRRFYVLTLLRQPWGRLVGGAVAFSLMPQHTKRHAALTLCAGQPSIASQQASMGRH